MEYVEWLATAEYYVGIPLLDNIEHDRFLESSIKHYKIVLENCIDQKLYNKTLHGIVLALHMIGKYKEAKNMQLNVRTKIRATNCFYGAYQEMKKLNLDKN